MPNWARAVHVARFCKGAATPEAVYRWPSLWVNRVMAFAQFEHDATEHAMRTARNRS